MLGCDVRRRLGAALLSAGLLAGVVHATVDPPQGYVGIDQTFSAEPGSADQHGFYNFDYALTIDVMPATTNGTFWANNFTFWNSAKGLPANHAGGDQGGYLGVQMKSETDHLAIFSVWWALDARPGPGATCLSDIEMWYEDDHPWEPAIDDPATTDPRRKVAGGPFKSCRLAVTLKEGVRYRLRLHEIADAGKPNDPEWWGAWLINDATGAEMKIGDLLVPGAWGWLNKDTGGFIEQFGPMPDGCESIPGMVATLPPATADGGAATASVAAHLYGACERALKARTRLEPGADGAMTVEIADP